MATVDETPFAAAGAIPSRRPLRRRVMHVVRRGHLYFGLFLLPWVILYGVTGFLFNHPTAFADAPTAAFDRSTLIGTPMESVPSPAEVAQQVVTAVRSRSNPPAAYELVQPERAKYNREAAFATVKADGRELNVLVEVSGNGGTVRSRPAPQAAAPAPVEKAPFAIGNGGQKGAFPGGPKGGGRPGGGEKGGRPGMGEKGPRPTAPADALPLESPLHDRVKAAVPTVLERTGFPGGEVTVTSVPDLTFLMTDGTKTWLVTYNAQAGTVSGRPADDAPPADELSTRRFLTRMHTAHGYPGEQNAKWYWAVVVDAMAFVMVFWGVSGIFMWWQIKATRLVGFLVLVVSVGAAVWLGSGMHEVLSAGGR
ncbi:Uncharacterized protein OS=Singulisphaera acidiphila (strain ATCC BAA-1392 / DSM 18658 / VKM B-2454 / MOB10) GN=Sinac_6475 PE=4 SV=1: PepSY_TM_1 [Gemmataceae bacterium]|nr:Uncharacterized protein OS=Singulisphaera acidiphila (strain ATCC BAA-1392 / DSM 18658 / VKM B-2454 / MOB10) GN=Sinac_6475 PE=4 SV=1: PepSY_TM_1 [Gemmataceae bacterium]VTT99736.1 Uncharacterized protein OS=Singulisphaera acidiphila (strain ATCC BAA-1392 / DSM 18658 / VKM B-2454 / MOB10) GN=Sinac_6475 PE=4 SV=1: PepSY_TM_1 [Gemmataceae bacterium]